MAVAQSLPECLPKVGELIQARLRWWLDKEVKESLYFRLSSKGHRFGLQLKPRARFTDLLGGWRLFLLVAGHT